MLLFPQACFVGSQTPLCEHKGDCRLQNPKSGGPLLARSLANFLLHTAEKSPFSGEAILGTQRYLEARFSTIAVYDAPVFFARGG